jgi:hypothetical protein
MLVSALLTRPAGFRGHFCRALVTTQLGGVPAAANLVLGIESTGAVEAAQDFNPRPGDDFFLDFGGAAKPRL